METISLEIGKDFIEALQGSVRVMLESSATVRNVIRKLERESSMEPAVKDAISLLSNAAGDLSQQWSELDLTLAAYDLEV
jgi:hypothetical protein